MCENTCNLCKVNVYSSDRWDRCSIATDEVGPGISQVLSSGLGHDWCQHHASAKCYGRSPLCTDLDVDSYLHLRMLYTQSEM